MVTILSTIFVLGVLIFIHEFGHFVAAKLFRIRVDRFSLGYPPRMVGKKIGDTDYCISWVPFGGYVKIAGMVDESMDKEALKGEPQPWEFRSKPWIQKALVILSGPMMNVAFTFVVFTLAIFLNGISVQVPGTSVGQVLEDTPAQSIGLKEGDRIVSVDGKSVESWQDMTDIIHNAPGRPLIVSWVRSDSSYEAEAVPQAQEVTDDEGSRTIGLIGIAPVFEARKVGVGRAIVVGGVRLYDVTRLILEMLIKLITREESIRSIGGPVRIAQMAGESARLGFGSLIFFMSFLSLNLAILNLLPIPVLDGGHMLFLSVEGIMRRQIPVKVKMAIQQVGMVLILGLMLFIMYNDIIQVIRR